jgi:8-oxo-dGTP pyrophosphatase MutT (NUDIX family)
MTKVTFYEISEIEDACLEFAVIAARYQDKWVFCRHKERSTWEIPGGHRELGEDIQKTAQRELYEETGAVNAELVPVCVYCVEKSQNVKNFGMLYWANITRLEALKEDSEMEEVIFTDILPKELTYPEIQPEVFGRIQGWLNLQSGAGELWDVYDRERNLTGRFHRRGEPLQQGDYHMVIHVWLQNRKGQFLITKRSPNKGFPNMWECTGGSALAGDDSLSAAMREVKEETGLTLIPENGKVILSGISTDYFYDIWVFQQDFELKEVVLLEGETCDVRYATAEEILKMQQEGIFVPYEYLAELFQKIGLIRE